MLGNLTIDVNTSIEISNEVVRSACRDWGLVAMRRGAGGAAMVGMKALRFAAAVAALLAPSTVTANLPDAWGLAGPGP